MKIAQIVGGVLIVGGLLVLFGYGLNEAVGDFFESSDIPVAVKVALPTVVLGFMVLIVVVIVERFKSRARDSFKEADY